MYIFPDNECPEPAKIKMLEYLATKSYKSDVVTYKDVVHGFAVRGDISKEHIRLAKQDAFDRSAGFLIDTLQLKVVAGSS